MKIAIIGTGISGLGAAYMLHKSHDITVYEKNDYIGGHSRTIELPKLDNISVDTGFIVYNERNYPLLTSLFSHLNVPTIKSDMSFGVSIHDGWLEYGSKNMLAQKRNLLRPDYWRMVANILKFNRIAEQRPDLYEGRSLGEFLQVLNMHHWFRLYYLQAMGAAIWSCSVDTILSFPAKTFITFFKNHGLLTVNNHPQWYTVKGGSREYVKRLAAPLQDKILYNCPVSQVRRDADGAYVQDVHGKVERYDAVIFSCHANESIEMMLDATSEEKKIIGAFGYQDNRVVVHSDVSFMPKRKGAWASWVYLSDSPKDNNASVSLSYWMNNLQSLQTETPVIVTLNPGREPRSEFIHDTHVFSHPVFTQETYVAQEKIPSIQGKNRYWFCGAYQRYGFHEDGLLSAVNIVKSMGVDIPWMK